MASLRIKLISIAAISVLTGGAWFVHSVWAAQAHGSLAQAPLNNQIQVTPAFIMAVDDSGSMTFQVLFRGLDGAACWSDSQESFYSGTQLRASGGSDCAYYYLLPHEGYTISRSGVAIPPIDQLGFSRSSEHNPSYFDPNPEVDYSPWQLSSGNPFTSNDTDSDGNANVSRTRADPANGDDDQRYWFNFEESRRLSDTRSRFRTRTGMVLPAGSEYYTTSNCGGIGTSSSTRNTWVRLSADHRINGTCNIGISYFPATYYLNADTPVPGGYRSDVVLPDSENRILGGRSLARNACGSGCDMYRYEIRPENYTSSAAYDQAIQRFANWFSYYGNRNRAMIAGMTRSMSGINQMSVGYFRLKDRPAQVTMYDMQDADEKENLFDAMMSLPASGGTPNLRAVDHIGGQFQRTGSSAPIQRACQKNAGMLFTDGFSNDGGPSAPAVTGLGAPFDPTPANSMAAIATRYYLNTNGTVGSAGVSPLRTGTGYPSGQVPVPSACASLPANSLEWKRLDCQSNLHMNFYGITLGARGEIFNPDLDPQQDAYLLNPAWPSHSDDEPSTIDDIWHATVNTRGEFINAKSPSDITAAMRRVLAAVSSGASPSGTLALTGSRINSRSLVVQPSYEIRNEGTDWFSELEALKLTVNPLNPHEVVEDRIWLASEKLAGQSYTSRRANTWYGTASGAAPIAGATLSMLCNNPMPGMSTCTEAEITSNLGVTANQAIDYLVGDRSLEVSSPGGVLRSRTTLLGDIINSTPVVSAPTDDYGYRTLGTVAGVDFGDSYSTYVDTTKSTRPAMVYVGANDGMLHAFHGGINASGDIDVLNGGREQFAYVPRAVLGHMGNLLFPYVPAVGGDQKFEHRYFVDGPLTVSDAYFSGWKTVLVGTAGAGGRSVFGLDVTNPTSFGSSSRLWEIDDQHSNTTIANNIGHVLGKPIIVPVRSGTSEPEWKAIFGNGYDSRNGDAALFIVDIATGTSQIIRAVEAAAPSGRNGLGNIVVTDQKVSATGLYGRDGFADTVYAADRKGAIWKFDLSSTATLTTPLFTTQTHTERGDTYRQPIIGGLVATAGVGNGVMLFFGTGSFSFKGDESDATIQSIYAVNDRGQTTTMTAADLFQRTIVATGATTRTISTGGAVGVYGWYLNLPARERAVGYPRVAGGVLFIPTYAPTSADGCSTAGLNWLYGLNTRTGGPALESVRFGSTTGSTQGTGVGAVALDTRGTAPVKEVGLAVLSRPAPPNPGETPPPSEGCWMRISVAGMTEGMFVPYPCGRQSWRQLQ